MRLQLLDNGINSLQVSVTLSVSDKTPSLLVECKRNIVRV